ncbi:hypothetical protein [Candidatus Palauibacter sp.]|uniref:hypothetical protein n=1 Tax=Candidatus Palauibacter sp. TaxID=3101350 RepID=UPI003B028560
MPPLRTEIERALDELISQQGGMCFQGLAVVLGKQRWPELVAQQRQKDRGLDAYAPASETPERIGKGLAASITPSLRKIRADAKTAKKHFSDLEKLLFVTPCRVGNADRQRWEQEIHDEHGIELFIIEREEVITILMMPENAALSASHLYLNTNPEPQITDLIANTRRAAATVTRAWAGKLKDHPLIDLTARRLDPSAAESADVLSLERIHEMLLQSRRIVLEGPAGRGKTTTLIQLAQRERTAGTPFLVDLPAWTSSGNGILEFIAGMPAFLAEDLSAADLARVQQTEPFLLLLNGWNEIAESSSARADLALRELERDFANAGIIVATRTHHLTPPLSGAARLRLMPARREQRSAYVEARLGAKGTEFLARIEADRSLEELTRTPFILSEVVSLSEAGLGIPSTKIGILAQVVRLQEQRQEHTNALQGAPIFGRQTDYLTVLASEMTRRGSVELPEAQVRAIVADVSRELARSGQIERAGAPMVLATLTAHHVLERVDYPETAFRFDHQQLQEYFAALDLRAQLLDLRGDDPDATRCFTADYVNDPAWAEPLRMIAATFAEKSGDVGVDRRNARVGAQLVEMALAVDLVFAGELAQLCGAAVWNEVCGTVGDRFRAVYAMRDGNFQRHAVAAMLATGMDDFRDIIVPLLSHQDEQARLRMYRLWPDIRVSSLGPNWCEVVRRWSDAAQADFVSELLRHRIDNDVATFAIEDKSIAVKMAAVSGLTWHRSDDVLTRVLESMDTQTFEWAARDNAKLMPKALRSETVAALRRFIETSADQLALLRTALDLVELGETGLDCVIKNAIEALPAADLRNLGSHYIQPALEQLRNTDPAWVSEWVAVQMADGVLYEHEYWLPFATAVGDHVVEEYLERLETEDLEHRRLKGVMALIAAKADAMLARRVVLKWRQMWQKVDAEPDQQHQLERQVIRQLRALFRRLPDDVAAAGIISSVTDDVSGSRVAARLLSRIGMAGEEGLRVTDRDLKARLRAYLKGSVDVVLREDDFAGEEKAHLASAIAQVGEPEDMSDLVILIRADIERVRSDRAARVAGKPGPFSTSYANWHVAAVIRLDPVGADEVLIDLLPEPEYVRVAAEAMARDFLPKPERSLHTRFRHDLMWAAREGRALPPDDDQRRTRFATALRSEITRLREQNEDPRSAADLKELARALAAIDGRGSAALVLDVIAIAGEWDEYIRLETADRLLMGGVALPATTAFALADSFLRRTDKWMQDSDRYLLRRILALCPLTDDPAAGIAKVREVLGERRLRGYELREVVAALGESRSAAATGLLHELASDEKTLQQIEDDLVNATAALDTPGARELLLSLVDPDIRGIALTRHPRCEDVLVARLTELAQRSPEVDGRLQELCDQDLPELNRHVLSRILASLGTHEALAANLNLVDDANPSPVPRGVSDQLESAFVEQRPVRHNPNAFTLRARASYALRARLFGMALQDPKRRESAFMLLGKIERWRLEHGRPTGEPRHPDLASGLSWPPAAP